MEYTLSNFRIKGDVGPQSLLFNENACRIIDMRRRHRIEWKKLVQVRSVLCGLLYYLSMIPFLDDFGRKGGGVFMLKVYVLAPASIVLFVVVVTTITMSRKYHRWLRKMPGSDKDKMQQIINMYLFKKELEQGNICLRSIMDDGIEYDVKINGKEFHRRMAFSTYVLWGCEDTVISFERDSVRFELSGTCES